MAKQSASVSDGRPEDLAQQLANDQRLWRRRPRNDQAPAPPRRLPRPAGLRPGQVLPVGAPADHTQRPGPNWYHMSTIATYGCAGRRRLGNLWRCWRPSEAAVCYVQFWILAMLVKIYHGTTNVFESRVQSRSVPIILTINKKYTWEWKEYLHKTLFFLSERWHYFLKNLNLPWSTLLDLSKSILVTLVAFKKLLPLLIPLGVNCFLNFSFVNAMSVLKKSTVCM